MKIRKAKTVKEVLIATKWIIENIGWCKMVPMRDEDEHSCNVIDYARSFCLSAAIGHVECDDQIRVEARGIAERFIGEHDSIIDWNDRWYRTKKHVISLLNKAIKAAS